MIVTCPFARVGCRAKVAREDLERHSADPSHTQLLLDAVMEAKAEAREAKEEASEAKTEAAEAKAEAVEAKAELERFQSLDTVACSAVLKLGERTDSFVCGGVRFHVELSPRQDRDLYVWLHFSTPCTIDLRLVVTVMSKVGHNKYHPGERLIDLYGPGEDLEQNRDMCHAFEVHSHEEHWPADDSGERATHFNVDVLVQKERPVSFVGIIGRSAASSPAYSQTSSPISYEYDHSRDPPAVD
jgi:hypothetical protein